jgi:hypothetical protein
MRILNTFLLAMMLISATANNYNQAMTNALETMKTARTADELSAVANQFERISNVEPTQWLPLYYQAFSKIRISFMLKDDVEKRDAYLDDAQKSIDAMLELSPTESEIYTLQSLLHTARLVIDPMTRGQQMMMKSGQAVGKAIELNPANPRAQHVLLSNEMGQAQFFGKDVSEFCPRVNALLNNWEELNKSPEFYPVWGKSEVQGLDRNCK